MSHTTVLTKIGERIRKIRADKNMTQYELALLCELEKASMSRIEAGKSNMTVRTLHKISTALGVHVGELFRD